MVAAAAMAEKSTHVVLCSRSKTIATPVNGSVIVRPILKLLGVNFLYFVRNTFTISWWRSIVVRTSVLVGELSLSCTRLMDGRLTTLWVKRLLSVNQQGQLSLPYLRGRLNDMDYGRWGPWYC